MISESKLVVSICQFLPTIPCVDPPLSDVSYLNSVVCESCIQVSSSLSNVSFWAVLATYPVDGIHRFAGGLLVPEPEQVLADVVSRFEGTGNGMHFKHPHSCF